MRMAAILASDITHDKTIKGSVEIAAGDRPSSVCDGLGGNDRD